MMMHGLANPEFLPEKWILHHTNTFIKTIPGWKNKGLAKSPTCSIWPHMTHCCCHI